MSGEQLTPSIGSALSLFAPLAKRRHRCGYYDHPLRWPLCSRRLEGATSSYHAMSSSLGRHGWPNAWNPPMRNSDDFPLVMAKSLRSGRSEGPVRTDDESSSCRLTTCVPRQSERHRSSSPRRLQHPRHCGGSHVDSLMRNYTAALGINLAPIVREFREPEHQRRTPSPRLTGLRSFDSAA